MPETALTSGAAAPSSTAPRHEHAAAGPEVRAAQELLRLCARTRLEPAEKRRIRQLAGGGVDWAYLLQQAGRHGVEPLLQRSLTATFASEDLPEEVRRRLDARTRRTALRNLLRTQELLEILDMLDAHGIEAVPLKGPTLSVISYGDPSLRRFIDLDVLVPTKQARHAYRLLVEKGYGPFHDRSEAEVQAHFGHGKSLELKRGDTLVELHWDFLHPMHGFYLDPADVRARAQTVMLGGQPIRTLAPEDLVLYLCAHGSKHFWQRLAWICDVAETLRTHGAALDWPLLVRRARTLHAGRMLLLGLQLASDLLGATLPEPVKEAARRDPDVQALVRRVADELFEERSEERQVIHEARFHLRMRERLRDRLPYYRHLAWLSVHPTSKDRAWITLSPSLDFAYYLVRPLRLATNGLSQLLGRSEGDS